jgi:GT2 family glycosyltransferase
VPTAVLQLDIDRLPGTLEIAQQYEQALILVRRRGTPVGQFYVPVWSGSVDMDTFHRAVLDITRRRSWQWELDDYLDAGAPPTLLPAATVAVCTRERPDDLVVALQAISALQPAPVDILVIDNNPVTSRTQEVVAKFPNVRYVREDRPGLDAARNRALLEATTPVVAFSDDDAAPEPEWLGHLLQPFEDPQVLCTSGLTLALELETPAQEWFERYSPFGRGFDRTVFDGIQHDPLEVSLIGAGANMALRRSVVDRVGQFDEALDAGTATRSGGDHEMFGRILAAGYRIVYEPRAVSWHRHRRTWDDLRATLNGYGRGVYAVWTRRLLYERHPGVLRHAFRWLHRSQLPRLWRSLRHDVDSVPLDLVFAELRGCLAGPPAYCKARRQVRSSEAP